MRKLYLLLFVIPAITFAQTYWQQDVNYKIDAKLNPTNHTITGNETLIYSNNSPDVLDAVYFRLYWNLFTEGSYGQKYARDRKEYYSGGGSGITLNKFTVNDNGAESSPDFKIDNTLMYAKLPRPLQPGESTTFYFEWEGKVPEEGYRTGHQGRDYNIAQWYPQIATYDKFGWDKSQYLGAAEFYNEYGSFDVSITIPKSFVLGYSGELLNPAEVYPDSILSRLENAKGSTETVRIADYTKTEWGAAESTLVTWKFRAENVRDFAWSANEHYIWDVIHWSPEGGHRSIRMHALYFSDFEEYWKNAAKYCQHTISYLSNHIGMYAYPNCFVVEGVVGGGMEYPGITFIGHYGDVLTHSPFGVVTHEVAHNWFPMMVGSNETYHAFMDEGFTTFLTSVCTEDYFGRFDNAYEFTEWNQKFFAYPNDDERQGVQRSSLFLQKSGYEEQIATHTYRFQHGQGGTSFYPKTASVLYMLQYVLGDSLFEQGFKEYFRKWQGRHPQPEDFYAVMQEVGGRRDLRWFFDQWFHRTSVCDYAIRGLESEPAQVNGRTVYRTEVSVRRNNSAIMPVDVEITMADGNKTTVWFPVDLWLNEEFDRDTTVDLPSEAVSAELNPDGRILDINRMNNRIPFPKVNVRFDNTIWNITPIDAYQVKWRPSLWYTDQGGWNLGYKISGSYLEDLNSATVWNAYNFRDRTVDYDVTLSHNMFQLTPRSHLSLRAQRTEGRKGITLSLLKEIRRYYGIPPYHSFRTTYSYSKADNRDYLLHPELWEPGDLQRITVGYNYYNRGKLWNVNATFHLEASSSLFGRSDFQYSKRTMDIKTKLTLPGGWNLSLRFYSGVGYGDIPSQASYYYSSSSPLEQMGEPLNRSKGVVPVTIRDHAYSPGGGLMRGYYGSFVHGGKLESFTAETKFQSFIPFFPVRVPVLKYITDKFSSHLFMDAGRISESNQRLWDRRFELDCGFGFRLAPFWSILGGFAQSDLLSSVGLNTLRIDFPIYVSYPPPGENKLKLRWLVSFSEAL